MSGKSLVKHIVFLVHYFPPINSSGAKRVEAISKYLARTGKKVTVITSRKSAADGEFTEAFPQGVEVLQLDWLGRAGESVHDGSVHEPMYTAKPSLKRRIKDLVMHWFGQLPDPRLPFAFSFLSPSLDKSVREVLQSADVVIGSCPPWPMLLATHFVRWRFGVPCVLDYRDHFSECHEMPGGRFAKWLELVVDKRLASRADALVTISVPMASYYSRYRSDVTVILNGYDHEAMDAQRALVAQAPPAASGQIVIRYLGIVSPGRVPRNMLSALSRLTARGELPVLKLRFEYYGSAAVMEAALRDDYPELLPLFSFHAAVPYKQSLNLMAAADYLLFAETSKKSSLSAQGILTTKLFEYLGSGRPVLADISPDTLAGGTICKAGTHHLVSTSADDFEKCFADPSFWQRRESIDSPFVKTLTRAYQARQYETLLDTVGSRSKTAVPASLNQ